MNPKQTVPPVATASLSLGTVAIPLLIGGAVIFALARAFSGGKKLETPPADAEKPADAKPAPAAPSPTLTPAPILPPAPKPAPVTVPVAVAKPPVTPVAPSPDARRAGRNVTRGDLAAIFNNRIHALTRTEAVAALKALGFGKTAAYKALSMDGRFAPLLQFAPGGIITWKG